jgi:hypothetical protein
MSNEFLDKGLDIENNQDFNYEMRDTILTYDFEEIYSSRPEKYEQVMRDYAFRVILELDNATWFEQYENNMGLL